MNFFFSSLRLIGYPIEKAIRDLNAIQNLSYQEFRIWQERSKWTIFNYLMVNNGNYHDFVFKQRNNTPGRWEDIPILTKKQLQEAVEKRLTTGFSRRNAYFHNTSGSSGHPFYFAKDKYCHAMTWAVIMDRYSRHGIDLNQSLQARFFGIPLTKEGYFKEKLKDKLSNRIRFPVFDLSDKVLESYHNTFSKHRFEYLNGYTSSLVLFAKYLNKQSCVLKEVCPTLKRCITTSEICSPEDRALMEKALGVRVVNEYGAAELDLIAFEDESFDWIMTNENLFFEVVDDENNPVNDGVEGKLLVTSLYNKAMPFIRYELGDIVKIDKSRKGNNQILGSLVGRTNDIAVLPSGKKSPGLTFYYISKSLLEEGGFLKEFIIKQINPEHFIFEYIAEHELKETQKKKIQAMVDLYLEPGLDCEFIRVNKIDRTKAGKFKHFQKLF